jgi:DNA-binding LacI/PurR family transcriptional regulator
MIPTRGLHRISAVCDDHQQEGAQFAQPALTTVKQSFYEAAVCAVDEVIAAAREKRSPRALVRVPTTPVLRRSCGCTVGMAL